MLIQKPERIRDPAYRRSAKGRMCDVPGCEDMETVVLAHIRVAGNCGTGLKPSDDESLFLCQRHHDELDDRLGNGISRALWIVRNIVIPLRKENYRLWKAEQKQGPFNSGGRSAPPWW